MAVTRRTLIRIAGGLLVLGVFLGVMLAGHFYLANRLVVETHLPEPYRGVALAAIFGFFALLVLEPFCERLLPRRRARLLGWPALTWMGFAFLGVVVLGASDLLLALGRGVVAVLGGTDVLAPSLELARLRAVVVLLVTLVAGLYALREGLSFPRTRRVEVGLGRWPRARDGFRIVQISDIHIGSLRGRAFAARLVARVNELDPDLIAITGDLVDGSVQHLGEEVTPFADLRARHGVFFVTGNHDHYSGAADWVARVEKLGLQVLRNAHQTLGEGEERFVLAGVDDHRGAMRGGDGGEDLEAALAGVAAERAVVLLAHDPATFPKASLKGIDLQLSGHTHAGQIWPFRYLVRLVTPFVEGLHRRGNAILYVSRGTGFWGPPMRLGSPSEITELCLRCAP